MTDIVFLGTGSGIPTKHRNHPSIWLRHDGDCFLFDCGEGTQRQLIIAGLSFMKIKHIFITHWHADHWAGLIGLLQTMNMENRKEKLYIYGPDAERFISDILDLDYWGVGFNIVPKDVPAEGDDIHSVIKTSEYEILSTPVEHSVPAVAYCFKESDKWNVDIEKATRLYGLKQGRIVGKLKEKGEVKLGNKTIRLEDVGMLKKGVKMVYSGDTAPCKTLKSLAKDCDILIHEATFDETPEDGSHSGAKEAAEIARKASAKFLVLTHFSRRYASTKILVEEARKYFPNSIAAEDYMLISLEKGKTTIKRI